MLQAQEASEGVAALKQVSGSAVGKAFDGDDHDSEDQGNEGFDEEEEEEEEEGDAALGSPMKKDAAGRNPRRNSIEFLQVRCSRQCRGCNALALFFVTKPPFNLFLNCASSLRTNRAAISLLGAISCSSPPSLLNNAVKSVCFENGVVEA
jgi:hypothetical protein